MATKLWAILLMLFTTLLASTAQLLYKLGAPSLKFDLISILSNYYIIAGILIYSIGGILMIISFRGGEVSVLYPIIATSYIWVSLLSLFFLHETMNYFRWAGVAAIILGIASIGYGSKEAVPGAL